MRRLVCLFITLGSLALVPAALASTTITVTSFGDSDFNGAAGCSGSGASISCPSLRDAVAYANIHFGTGGATIQLKGGIYTVTNSPLSSLSLSAPVTIAGVADTGSGATIIQNSLPGAALRLDESGGTTTLSQLELTGGLTGLAVEPTGANTTFNVDHVNVTGNTTTGVSGSSPGVGGSEAFGGGIYYAGSSGSALNLTNSLVEHNIVTGGSGEAFASGPCPSGGADDGGAAYGGGLYLSDYGTVTISGTTISGNSITGGNGSNSSEACPGGVGGDAVGAGVFVVPNGGSLSVKVMQSTIDGNTATTGQDGVGEAPIGIGAPTAFGGGIADGLLANATSGPIPGAALTVESSTINNNQATTPAEGKSGASFQPAGSAYGGGIAAADPSAVVAVNSTLFENTATSGGTPTGAGNGNAEGGGVFVSDPGSSANFGNLTVFGNAVQGASASHEVGGNLDGSDVTLTFADSVFADPGPSGVHNCVFGIGTVTVDGGYNLEDDSTKTCGFSKATDHVTAAGLASSLTNNGGPTLTLLPLAGSPVIGNGGACFDPTASAPGTPLTTDQRGQPRGSACDIGAVQVQGTSNTALPTLSGTAAFGHTLTCERGGWTGDGLEFVYEWLRDGSVIPDAGSYTYTLGNADVGSSISCRVTALGVKGDASATSAAENVTVGNVTLFDVSELHAKWRESGKSTKRKPVGTAFKFTVSGAAKVTLTFEQPAKGRRSHGRCVAATHKNRKLRACALIKVKGTVVVSEGAGSHTVAFAGKPTHGGKLKPGKYEVVIQAVGANGKASKAFTLKFTITR